MVALIMICNDDVYMPTCGANGVTYRSPCEAGCLVQIFFGVGGVVGFLAAAFILGAGAGYLNTQNDDWMVWGCCAGIPLGAIVGAEFATWFQALSGHSLE